MKILIDARLYGLENAGLGRYVLNLITEISKIDKKNEYVVLLRKKYFEKLKLPGNWTKVLADFRHYGFLEQILLPSLIKKHSPDVTHFPHFNVPIFYRGPFIVTIHDMLMHKQVGMEATTLPPIIYFIKRFGYRIAFDAAIKNSTAIIVPSRAVKEELKKFYGLSDRKFHVTYEGLDKEISSGGKLNIPGPYFVYVGSAYPHKNLERLVRAIVDMNKKSDQRTFLAIASSRNIFTQRLSLLIKRLKAEEYIKLLGFVPDESLGNLYNNSEAFVFPSTSEGFGLPGVEAMRAGTLVLASDIPVFREVFRDNAVYFNPLETTSIEKAMKDTLKMNQEEKERRIKKGEEFSKQYSWAKMAKETLKIYEESGHSLRSGK